MSNIIPKHEKPSAPLSLEGGRRPSGKDNGADSQPDTVAHCSPSDPEVRPAKPRRSFTAKYKLNILDELDRCTAIGEKGAILRREGLYTSLVTTWRQQRNDGALSALNNVRGRKKLTDNKDQEITKLEQEVDRLKAKLLQAETIIDVQKKVSMIFGIGTPSSEHNENSS